MKQAYTVIISALLAMMAVEAVAAPTLTAPVVKSIGANMATLELQASADGSGYFTILDGSNQSCGTGVQVAAHAGVHYFGSLPLQSGVPGNYTIRNLPQNTSFTICFTADSPKGANLNPVPLSANFTTTGSPTITHPGWGVVGTAGIPGGQAHFTSLAFAPDGVPYLAYVDANDSYKTTVISYSGGSWSTVGGAGFVAGKANPASLAFSPDGSPHIAFVDSSFQATVMKYSGSWNSLGSGLPADSDTTALAFAPDGIPNVSYIDGVTSKASVMQCSAGICSLLGGGGISAQAAWYSALAFAPDGTPYIAFEDFSNGSKATVMKFNGSVWNLVGNPGMSVGAVGSMALAVAPNGTPYVAYVDLANASKATVMQFTAGNWSPVGVAGFSAGSVSGLSLALAPDGSPWVAFQDGSNGFRAAVLKFAAGSWSSVGGTGVSAGVAGSTSLAFAPDSTPYLAFRDDANGSRATVMRFGEIPTISGNASTAVVAGNAYSFTPTATNATGFSVTNKPSWASFDAATGSLSGSPTVADIGTYSNIVITALNNFGSASLPAFAISVSGTAAPGSVKIGANSYATLNAALLAASNGSVLKILASITPEVANHSASGVITLDGGYDAGWNKQPGLFAPISSLTITGGTFVIDQIVVK